MKSIINFVLKYKWQLTGLFIFILNFCLKIIFVSETDIGLDEPFTLFNSQLNLSQLFQVLKNENNPPFYFIIMHCWLKIFGYGVVSARFLSILFSAATPVILLFIAKRFLSFQIAITYLIIFSGATIHYFYAHDSRVYSLFVFLSTLNLYYYLKLIDDDKKTTIWNLVFFGTVNILLCYSHYFGFVIICSEFLCCIILKKIRNVSKLILTSLIIVLISYWWYIPIVVKQFVASSGGTWIARPVLSDLYTMLWRFSNTPLQTVGFISIIIIFYFRKNNIQSDIKYLFNILLTLFLINYIGLFIVSQIVPVFIDRYLLYTSIYFYILFGIASCCLFKKLKYSNLFPILIAASLFITVDLKRGKDIRVKEMVNYIRPKFDHEFTIIIAPQWFDLNFIYYYKRSWFLNHEHFRDSLAANNIYPLNNVGEIKNVDVDKPIYYINNNTSDSTIEQFLNSNFTFINRKYFGKSLYVTKYEMKIKI